MRRLLKPRRIIIAKIFNTYDDVDIHVKILTYMFKQQDYIPVFYQMALIKGLSSASEGIVLQFFAELAKKNIELLYKYFGTPMNFVEPEHFSGTQLEDLKKLL